MSKTLFLVAGEPSGDRLGARLINSLRAQEPHLHFTGVGGPEMINQGLESLFPMEDLAVMGLAEIIPRLPLIMRRLRQTARAVAATPPAAVITIDSPDFCMRLAARLRDQPQTRGIPRIHYVAPSVWAWRPGRAKTMARLFDLVLALLPFEPPFFQAVGLDAVFVGHPAIETKPRPQAGQKFRARHAIDPHAPLLCILPGSRGGEIARHGPIFHQSLDMLAPHVPQLTLVAPTLAARAEQVKALFADSTPPVLVVTGEDEKQGAFAAANAALAVSGTVLLELAMTNTPMVAAYRLTALSGILARHLIRIPYVSLVNLVADVAVHPEYLQEACRADALAAACRAVLTHKEIAQQQTRHFPGVLAALGLEATTPPGAGSTSSPSSTPSKRAAQAIMTRLTSPPPPHH